eukprot:GEMP01025226.1.p1 GENE.GEMP01025226.1~~GEMP01025226.1.p1  ORF type:complete len:242 (+),score=44.99 GEMP01025226.1:793-1518(+)
MVVFSSFGSNKGLEHAAVEIMKVLVPWKDQGAGYHFYVTEASPGIEATNIGDHTAPYFVSESGCKLPFSNKDIHPYIRFVKGVQEVSAKAIPRYERTWWMKPIGDTLFSKPKNPSWEATYRLSDHCGLKNKAECSDREIGAHNNILQQKKNDFSPFCIPEKLDGQPIDFLWNSRHKPYDAYWYDIEFRGTWKDGQPLGEHVKLVVDRTVAAPEYSYAKPTEPPSWKIQEDRNTDPPKATVE